MAECITVVGAPTQPILKTLPRLNVKTSGGMPVTMWKDILQQNQGDDDFGEYDDDDDDDDDDANGLQSRKVCPGCV